MTTTRRSCCWTTKMERRTGFETTTPVRRPLPSSSSPPPSSQQHTIVRFERLNTYLHAVIRCTHKLPSPPSTRAPPIRLYSPTTSVRPFALSTSHADSALRSSPPRTWNSPRTTLPRPSRLDGDPHSLARRRAVLRNVRRPLWSHRAVRGGRSPDKGAEEDEKCLAELVGELPKTERENEGGREDEGGVGPVGRGGRDGLEVGESSSSSRPADLLLRFLVLSVRNQSSSLCLPFGLRCPSPSSSAHQRR